MRIQLCEVRRRGPYHQPKWGLFPGEASTRSTPENPFCSEEQALRDRLGPHDCTPTVTVVKQSAKVVRPREAGSSPAS